MAGYPGNVLYRLRTNRTNPIRLARLEEESPGHLRGHLPGHLYHSQERFGNGADA